MRSRRAILVVTSAETVRAFLPPLIAAFKRAGWDVWVVSAPDDSRTKQEHLAAPWVHVPMVRGIHPLRIFGAIQEMRSLVATLAPDVVLCATPVASMVGAFATRLVKGPKVIHLAWGLRSQSMAQPARGIVASIEHLTSLLSQATVANSESLAKIINSRLPNLSQPAVVLGRGSSHGVSLTRFPYSAPPPRQEPAIGFIGRVRRDKGVEELLTAAQILRHSGHRFRLVIVGGAEEPPLLQRILADPDVEYRPFTASVSEILRDLDIVCLPTWREGFPNVVLEAGAAGRPVVTTRVTGAIDSVVDGVTGITVPVRAPRALAQALETLLADPELRRNLGAAAREWVEEGFEEAAVCDRLVTFVQSTIGPSQ